MKHHFTCKTEIITSIDLVFHHSRVGLVLRHMGVSICQGSKTMASKNALEETFYILAPSSFFGDSL